MKTIELLAGALFLFAAGAPLAHASDPVAVYARVDKVTLVPNPESPERIQISGVFAVARPNDPNEYLPPARGYFYFKLADNGEAARKEWNDLNEVAGTVQIVTFGRRWGFTARLRKRDERPESPDPYSTNVGIQKVRGRTEYAPVRALLDYKD